jgi:hypothetical protein
VISEAEGTAEAVERELIEQRRKDKWSCHEGFESEKRIKKLMSCKNCGTNKDKRPNYIYSGVRVSRVR